MGLLQHAGQGQPTASMKPTEHALVTPGSFIADRSAQDSPQECLPVSSKAQPAPSHSPQQSPQRLPNPARPQPTVTTQGLRVPHAQPHAYPPALAKIITPTQPQHTIPGNESGPPRCRPPWPEWSPPEECAPEKRAGISPDCHCHSR